MRKGCFVFLSLVGLFCILLNQADAGGWEIERSLWAGDEIKARLLHGANVAGGVQAKQHSAPLLFSLLERAWENCSIVAFAHANTINQRIEIQVEHITCLEDDKSEKIYPVKAYAVGSDRNAGIIGKIISPDPKHLAKLEMQVVDMDQPSSTFSNQNIDYPLLKKIVDAKLRDLHQMLEIESGRIVVFHIEERN